jgi:hypothetical protein
MTVIVSVVVGVVVLIALYAFVPTIGMQIEGSTTIPTTSIWSTGTTTTGPAWINGSELWIQVSSLPVLAVLAVFVAIAIGYFVMIGRR